MCISNTFFPHKRIHLALWFPPGPTSKPSLKDYVLVMKPMISVLDTRVHRGRDMDSDHHVLSPLLFNCFNNRIVRETMVMTGGGLHVEYTTSGGLFLSYREKTPLTTCIQNAQYVEDLTLVAENRKEQQQILDALDRACTRWGMRICGDKTKVMGIGEPPGPPNHHTE